MKAVCIMERVPIGRVRVRKLKHPDYQRHYTRNQLTKLLCRYFSNVEVDYSINEGRLIHWGVYRPSMRAPIRSIAALISLFFCNLAEVVGLGGKGPGRERHLIAVARTAA